MIELKVDDNLDDLGSEFNDDGLVTNPTVIKIFGCGGGGSSAVRRMIEANVTDVEFYVLNTDVQALKKSPAANRIPIGRKLTGGLGAGGNPAVGENAANEDSELISKLLDGADMVIITAGMGGGTGTGSAPVVAKLAHDAGILTIAVVTTPFAFEGKVRMDYALEGIAKLRQNVDSLIVIPNEQVTKIVDKNLNYLQAFRLADNVLCQGVQGISEIITVPGEMNLDFNDVKAVMKNAGEAILGVGFGEGENRIVEAAQSAISNPLLENRTIDGAKKLLVNICSDENLAMSEIKDVVNNIKASAAPDVAVFVGLVNNPEMNGKISITVIATGFDDETALSFDDGKSEKKSDNIFSPEDLNDVLKGRAYRGGDLSFSSSEKKPVNNSDAFAQSRNSKFSTMGLGKNVFDTLSSDVEEEEVYASGSLLKNDLFGTPVFDKSENLVQEEEKSEPEERYSSESAMAEKNSSDYSASKTSGSGFTFDSSTIDKNDTSLPSVLRNGRSSFSRKIKLGD